MEKLVKTFKNLLLNIKSIVQKIRNEIVTLFKRTAVQVVIYLIVLILILMLFLWIPSYIAIIFRKYEISGLIFGIWNASDTISYTGTILGSVIGAAVTIIAVIITLLINRDLVQKQIDSSNRISEEMIRDNQKRFDEERRLSVLPVITINKMMFEIKKIKLPSELKNDSMRTSFGIYQEEDCWVEYLFDEVVVCFTNTNQIRLYSHLTTDQKEIMDLGVFRKDGSLANNNGTVPYLYSPYYLTNSGIGALISLRIKIIEKLLNNEMKEHVNCMPINLKASQDIKIIIFAEKYEFISSNYILGFEYRDIYNNTYIQEHEFYFDQMEKAFILNPDVNQRLKKG